MVTKAQSQVVLEAMANLVNSARLLRSSPKLLEENERRVCDHALALAAALEPWERMPLIPGGQLDWGPEAMAAASATLERLADAEEREHRKKELLDASRSLGAQGVTLSALIEIMSAARPPERE